MTARRIAADDVCAYVWAHTCDKTRGALCACASLPSSLALLEWYELNRDQQAALRGQIADVIESNASRQREEYVYPERAA